MSNNTTGTSGGSSLFGAQGSGSTAPALSNVFGQNAQSSNSGTSSPFGGGQTSLFGGGNNQSGGFGALSQSNSVSQTNSNTGLFGSGSAAAGGSSFGKPAETRQEGGGGGGGNASSIFSTPNKASASSEQTSNIFGHLTSNQASSASSGSATPTTSKPAFSLGTFSTTPAGNPPSSNLFPSLRQQNNDGGGNAGTSQTTSQAAEPASRPATSNIFGGQQQTSSSTPQPSGSLFGSITSKTGLNAPQSSQESTKPGPFSFPSAASQQTAKAGDTTSAGTGNKLSNAPPLSDGNPLSTPEQSDPTKATTTTEKPSLFATANPTSSSTPSLFANLNQNQSQNQTQNATSSSSPFSSFGQTAANAAGSGLFANLGQAKDAAADSTAKTQENTSAAPTSTSAPTTLFGGQSRSEQGTSSSKPAESTSTPAAAPAGTPATLGSSTSGPPPTAQSRLKNKSMDEIITRWASDLAKYQKEFQVQAEKVAEWDRLLLENGNALSKLYSKTFQAERDTAEVEKQISTVEGQQDELKLWLDKYEREVDEMMSRQVGQGEGLQGPDQERERTYKTAERVSERLDEMGKDLTSMIEEINDASTAISKTSKPDDPLSQIVRVLNGHLSQLQLIDQGTAALQAKVTTAQQQSQRLGSRVHGGYSDAADTFYRSYGRG